MQFGVSTFLWESPFNTRSFDLVYKIKHMGFDIIEVPIENKSLIDWSKLKEVVKDLDLNVTISGAFGAERDISSLDPIIRRNGLKYIQDCIEIAAFMESPIFGGPLYSAEQKKIERKFCVDNLRLAGKTALDYGVILGMEPLNRFESDMVNTVDQALSIVREVDTPNLKIQLDTFHDGQGKFGLWYCLGGDAQNIHSRDAFLWIPTRIENQLPNFYDWWNPLCFFRIYDCRCGLVYFYDTRRLSCIDALGL